jgi:hypothetical protein
MAGGSTGDDPIDVAAGNCLFNIKHLEKELDFDKLRWKVASVFRKMSNSMSFQGPLQKLIDEYADKSFQQLAGSIGDRDWLPQVDLTLVLDAAVKQGFPPNILAQAGPLGVESMVVASYDRAFDEIRVLGLLWQCLQGRVEGKKTQNKAYAALESCRLEAVRMFPTSTSDRILTDVELQLASLPALEKVQRFISRWVRGAIDTIAKAHGGDPSSTLSQENACQMFQKLLQSGTLPIFLNRELQTQGCALPQPYTYIDEVVGATYQPYLERVAKKQRVTYNRPKTAYCYYHYQGTCGFGVQCKYAHHESELPPHMILFAPWSMDADY